ncbi:MAG: type II toxin-antitoxin system YafQ family toxin [Victivallales bacterium]|nr:type II toxin-antitoxin system YafQ family toxin [Victivallales bacterium]
MKYEVKFTSQFKKDYKLAIKRGRDISILEKIIEMLADGQTLPEEYNDHQLIGNFKGCRECHIAPDWLLIYKLFEDVLVLELSRTGTHSDLF